MCDEEARIAETLRGHPGARDAAVFADGDIIRIFVVPDDGYLDDELGRKAASELVLQKWRKTFDLSQLAKGAESATVGLNTLGWNSSYTLQPIPEEEMREWVERSVENILSVSPCRVYEAGCGTGMLALRLAPHCERYTASDFAPAVLSRFRAQLVTLPALDGRVEILERRADDFAGLERNCFDTFLLNSVTQHFPNLSYLTKVIAGAVGVVKPGGRLLIGDIRSLQLLPVFACSVEAFQAAPETGLDELRARIRRRIERETQLVISPAYFLALRSAFPAISRVEIVPLRGRARNEMTHFRYDAILHVGAAEDDSIAMEFTDWSEAQGGLDEIRSFACSHPGQAIGIEAIRNARIAGDVRTLVSLENGAADCSVKQLREEVRTSAAQGIDPQALLDMQDEIRDCAIFLSWAACRRDGSYDAAIVPRSMLREGQRPAIDWPRPDAAEFVRIATAPGQQAVRKELEDRLTAYCVQNLPATAGRIAIELVDALPRAADVLAPGDLRIRRHHARLDGASVARPSPQG
jgi:SAM-dependent methyltransferase